ncbi:uncharacterized protein LOC121392812 [Gigantopelta aegis]|uniref:uncharacterized protein LOC121392812 n=1 Tax=Gigantopelta aegis TaxID=1735272 RepID=UPI001B88A288|nr:uncharacterized protein LOC121392812 [Gigantopelta aegis]
MPMSIPPGSMNTSATPVPHAGTTNNLMYIPQVQNLPTTSSAQTGNSQQALTTPPPWIVSLCEQIAQLTSTTSEIYKRTERLETIETKICTIESSLMNLRRSVDAANERITKVEQSCQFMSNTFEEIRSENNQLRQSVNDLKETEKIANDDIVHLSKTAYQTQDKNQRLYDDILYLQTRSMRFNLLFSGLPDQGQNENTEEVVKTFIKKELEITEDTPIQVTHRLGPYRQSQSRPRTIVAHFQQLKDKDKIKMAAKTLAGKPFGINDQYPREIAERRKELYPVYRKARR